MVYPRTVLLMTANMKVWLFIFKWNHSWSPFSEVVKLITLTSFEKQSLNTNQQLNQEPKEGTWWQFHPREITETNPFCSEQKSQRKHGRFIRSHPSLRAHFHSLTDTEKMPVAESQQWHWQGDFMEDSPNRNPMGKKWRKIKRHQYKPQHLWIQYILTLYMEEANLLLFDLLLWHNFGGFLRLGAGSNRSSLLLLFYRTWGRRKVSIIWFLVFLRYSKMCNTKPRGKGMKPRLCPLLNVLFLNSVPSYWPAGAVAADTHSDSRDQLQKTDTSNRLEQKAGIQIKANRFP